MQVIVHDLGGNLAVLHELCADVEILDVLAVVELGDDLVDLDDLGVTFVRNLLTAREDGEHQDLSMRRFVLEVLDDGSDAVGNLFGAVAAGVVGADHKDPQPWA